MQGDVVTGVDASIGGLAYFEASSHSPDVRVSVETFIKLYQ